MMNGRNKRKSKALGGKQAPIDSLKGYIIFMALSVSAASALLVKPSLITLVVALVVGWRILKTQQDLILLSCLALVLLYLVYYFYLERQRDLLTQWASSESVVTRYTVDPNTVSVDGAQLALEGISRRTGEKVALFYYLGTSAEKVFFEKLTDLTELEVNVELTTPKGQRNLNGFNYQGYLLEKGIYRTGTIKEIVRIKKIKPAHLVDGLKVMRRKLSRHITDYYGTTTGVYLKSLFLGVKDSEFKNQQEPLKKLGILHFFSISGMHVLFLVGTFRYLMLRLGLSQESFFWLQLSVLFCFLFLSGFSTSVGRAVIYVSMVSLNQHFRLGATELDCWAITLLIGVLLNPYLLFQAAGQLSYGLTFIIIYLKPIATKLRRDSWRTLFFSLVLSVFSVPIISYHFFEWHVLSLVLTFMLMPLFTRVLLPVLGVNLLFSFTLKVAFFPRQLENLLAAFQQTLVKLGELPWGHIVTGKLPLAVYLSCLVLILYWLASGHKQGSVTLFTLCLLLLVPGSSKYLNPKGMIAFVDIGQGDALLIQRPFHQKATVVDVGGRLAFEQEPWQTKTYQRSNASQTLLPLLKSLGIKKLDQVFITHGHEDHFGDLLALSEVVKLEAVLFPKGLENRPNFTPVVKELQAQGVPLQRILAGTSWQFGEVNIKNLYPETSVLGENNDSLILAVKILNKAFLLTGDLEKEGEAELLALHPSLQTNILGVGHHGSKSSSAADFLKGIAPQEAIISCGEGNRFGHPHQEVLERLAKQNVTVYRTDQQGMVYYNWFPWSAKLLKAKTIN